MSTAQSVKPSTSKYFAVNTLIFPEIIDPVPFDIYLRLGPNKYTKVFSRGLEIERERLNSYILKGTENFYILKQDRRNFLVQSQKILGTLYSKDQLDREEALHILTDLAAQTLSEIFTNFEFDYTCYELSTTLVSGYLAVTHKHPSLLPALIKMAKTKRHLYHHSIMTALFSCLLARQMEPENKQFHLNAGLAGFLHDIGLCKVSEDLDEHSINLTGDNRMKLMDHPQVGANMLSGIRDISPDVVVAISQHHENMNGTGYPNQLPADKITRTARLVALTEEFSALIGGSKENVPLSPSLAMHALRATDRFDSKVVDALAKLLNL